MSEPPHDGRLRSPRGGRVVVVTGAAGGIGRSCALLLAGRGADLALADLDADQLSVVAAEARALGVRVHVRPVDVTREDDCAALVEGTLLHLGRLDGAVLAAGTAHHAGVLDLTSQQWRTAVEVHLTATFLCLQAVARQMAPGGAIVCLSSTVAEVGGPPRQAHYVAGKAGTLGLVRAAARELGARGVRVNAVSPGFTETGMNTGLFSDEELAERVARAPLGRLAVPDDIATVVAFLLGADAAFVTGQNIRVDGGASLA